MYRRSETTRPIDHLWVNFESLDWRHSANSVLVQPVVTEREFLGPKLSKLIYFTRISPIFQRMVWRLQGSSHHEVTPEGHEGPWRSAIENLRCKEMKIMKPRVTCCNIWNNDVTSLIIYNHMRILWGCVVHIRYIYMVHSITFWHIWTILRVLSFPTVRVVWM